MQAGRRGHRLEEGRRALSRHAHPLLAQDQMHPAPGIRDRRLVGKRQALRLPLAAAGGEGARQADLCRQGRHRLLRQADRADDGADETARSRQGAGRGAARRPQGRAFHQAASWSPRSPSPSSPATASCATRASSACARTSRRRRWCVETAKHLPRPRRSRRRRPPRELRHQDQQPRSRDLSRRGADQGRARRLLRRGRAADHGRCARAGR